MQSRIYQTNSIEEARDLINKARKTGTLEALLKAPCTAHRSLLARVCHDGLVDLAEYYLSLQPEFDILSYIHLEDALHDARYASFHFPHHFQAFDRICDTIRSRIDFARIHANTETCRAILRSANPSTLQNSQSLLFSVDPITPTRAVLAQCHFILSDITRCAPFIRQLNEMYHRYCIETHGKVFSVDKSTYDYKPFSDIYFPIPNHRFVGLKKQSALQVFLVSLFRQVGLASDCYKWMGSVSETISNQHIMNGFFFTEDRFDIGLFHNKLTHMLQQIIILLAIQSNAIDNQGLTLNDIFSSMVTETTQGGEYAWIRIRDSFSSIETDSLCSPFRLSEAFMYRPGFSDCQALRDSMIDSFCKGFLRQLALVNDRLKENNAPELSPEAYIRKLNDKKIHRFDSPPTFFSYSLARDIALGRSVSREPGNAPRWAIVKKEYAISHLRNR